MCCSLALLRLLGALALTSVRAESGCPHLSLPLDTRTCTAALVRCLPTSRRVWQLQLPRAGASADSPGKQRPGAALPSALGGLPRKGRGSHDAVRTVPRCRPVPTPIVWIPPFPRLPHPLLPHPLTRPLLRRSLPSLTLCTASPILPALPHPHSQPHTAVGRLLAHPAPGPLCTLSPFLPSSGPCLVGLSDVVNTPCSSPSRYLCWGWERRGAGTVTSSMLWARPGAIAPSHRSEKPTGRRARAETAVAR